jgi:hypothetical protein
LQHLFWQNQAFKFIDNHIIKPCIVKFFVHEFRSNKHSL